MILNLLQICNNYQHHYIRATIMDQTMTNTSDDSPSHPYPYLSTFKSQRAAERRTGGRRLRHLCPDYAKRRAR